ncbi:transposase family protein [Streptosporangium minutum]|uniref:transposase family protein n=1 Tax=Streptosporangium minutum TaxID=569862 RepID=UPI001F60AF00|nr:transposase family protein [Streptosporangium minutum]
MPVRQPTDGNVFDVATRIRDMLLRALRCLGERGFALLTQRWRTLQRITVSPSKIGDIARAVLVLAHFEHSRLI